VRSLVSTFTRDGRSVRRIEDGSFGGGLDARRGEGGIAEYPAVVWLPWLIAWAAILVAATLLVGICDLVASGLSFRDRRTPAHRSTTARRAGRRFADLVATGDFDAAEAAAEQAFAKVRRPRVVEWDERVVLGLSLEEARQELTGAGSLTTWFPDLQRVFRGEVAELLLEGGDPVPLTVVSTAWTPDLDGVMFELSGGAFSISGSLSLRTVVTGADVPHLRTAVEVAVRMETSDLPEARRALARARHLTHEGLHRMAAMFEVR
jgi:hypothetical protein